VIIEIFLSLISHYGLQKYLVGEDVIIQEETGAHKVWTPASLLLTAVELVGY
jgi:hypothetical protein